MPVDKYTPMHTPVYGHPGVHIHRCPGLSPWTHQHSCTYLFTGAQRHTCTDITVQAPRYLWYPCTYMYTDEHQRIHEPKDTRANKNTRSGTMDIPMHRLPGARVYSPPLPSRCAHLFTHTCTRLGTQGVYVHRASTHKPVLTHSRAQAPWAACVHTQTQTLRLVTVAMGV